MRYAFLLPAALGLTLCASEELVRNGDFEKGLAPWKCEQRRGGKKDLHVLSPQTKFGKVCLRASGDPENKYNSFIALVQDLPGLDKETEYRFQVKARPAVSAPEGKSFKVAIRQADGKGTGLGYTGFTLKLSGDTWQTYEMRFKPDRRAESCRMYLIGSNLTQEDAVYVDDVSLSPLVDAPAFDPAQKKEEPGKILSRDGISAKISEQTGLLCSLSWKGTVLQPEARNSAVVFIRQGNRESLLDGKNTVLDNGRFRAKAEYGFADGFFREVVTIEALADLDASVKIGVRHGFFPGKWEKIVNALRPLRIINAGKATIFSYGENPGDFNPGELDQYQHTAYPMSILENADFYLLAGSRTLDDFVTISPNMPAGYWPSVQQNPRKVRKGDRFRFEINWKLYPKSGNRLRDVWRDYSDHLRTSNPELAKYIPRRSVEERTFYPGLFGSHTYFVKEREDRLRPGTNVWFYSWHDNISERYPVAGEWWSAGNNWREKLTPLKLKTYMDTLQKEKKFNLILYLRQLANLKQRGKEFPDGWYRRTPGGALHLYGGGYEVKLPQRVAQEVGYDRIPLGQYDFSNPEYRDFYHKEIFKAIRYYTPRAIGWDMGSDLNEFLTIARTYETIRKEKLPVKVVANESAGPTQLYSDMVLLENGFLGGKSSYDFEIARAYTTAVVCLERFNLFHYAVAANLDGKRTWLTEYGLAENKRYLDALLKRRPELRQDRAALSRLCQLRASIYDLSLGASPGYLEEAQPAPESLMQMAGDVNGLFGVNQSFMLKLPNGLDTDGRLSVSAWQNAKQFRLAAYNDDAQGRQLKLRLDRKFFQEKGWDLKTIAGGKHLAVTPEGESPVEVRFRETSTEIVLETELPAFGALLLFADR